MSHKDDLLRAADIIVSCSDLALGFPHAKEYADLASRLRAAAQGQVMVPLEPTEKMVLAAWTGSDMTKSVLRKVYRAMLAAAPGGKDGK